jgi:hypothetical protein
LLDDETVGYLREECGCCFDSVRFEIPKFNASACTEHDDDTTAFIAETLD